MSTKAKLLEEELANVRRNFNHTLDTLNKIDRRDKTITNLIRKINVIGTLATLELCKAINELIDNAK